MQYRIFVLRFDDRGRIVFPVVLRETFGAHAVFASNMVIYIDDQTWARKGGRSKIVAYMKPDRIWRVLIPLEFRGYFPDRAIVLVWEEGDTIQLWSKERWTEHLREMIETA